VQKGSSLNIIQELLDDFLLEIRDMFIFDPGVDQKFLAEMVYPIIKDNVLIHSEHYDVELFGRSEQRKFSTEDRYPENHIGAALDENDNYRYLYDVEQSGGRKYKYDFDLLGEQ